MYHRATEQIRLEGTLKDHLVQPFMGNGDLMTLETLLVKNSKKRELY